MVSLKMFEAAQMLKNSDNVMIVFHKNPDGDALGSSLALFWGLKQLKKKCKIIGLSAVPSRFNFMLEGCSFDNFDEGFVVAVDFHYGANLEVKFDQIRKGN